MSNPSEATLPVGPDGDAVDESRRKLLLASCIAGGAATGAVAWPFLASLEPSARARALGAPVEADISSVEAGQMLTVEWQGKPVWILRRTSEMLDTLQKDEARLADPNSKRSQQPEYCRNIWRAREEKKDSPIPAHGRMIAGGARIAPCPFSRPCSWRHPPTRPRRRPSPSAWAS